MKKINFFIAIFSIFYGCNPIKNSDAIIDTVKSFLKYYQNNVVAKEKIYVAEEVIEGRQYDWTWNAANSDSLKSKKFKRVAIKKWDNRLYPRQLS